MNRIRLLSEHVANQIAAGEVVERPASVVKELVENALDARATRITVETLAGGRSMVRVTDDGTGMNKDDALLSLERHATSKIQEANDLKSIVTMGFRGEALPSIASVSRMTITTREPEAEAGTQIVIHGGRILSVQEAGAPPGTAIEVRQLFFNLPARRKFLRTEETERAHIQHYTMLAALAAPEVAFTLIQENRLVWQLAPLRPSAPMQLVLARLRELYGAELPLVPVDFTAAFDEADADEPADEGGGLRVWGYIGAPGVSRGTREDQHLFVNRRPIESKGLNYALMEGCHNTLMKGRFPVCCLFLEINPAQVDVNIHPAKREVKFHKEYMVRRAVSQAVRKALVEFHSAALPLPEAPADIEARPGPDAPGLAAPRPAEPLPAASPSNESILAALPPPLEQPRSESGAADSPKAKNEFRIPAEAEVPADVLPAAGPALAPVEPVQMPILPPENLEPATGLLAVPLRIAGVVGDLYVLLESDRGLVLLDQHAAHERILYEQALARLESGHAPSQRLLLPETIELSPKDAEFLREQIPHLLRLGVGLSEFGERTFLLDALPPFVRAKHARGFVIELIDELKAAGGDLNSWRLGESVVAKTVCRQAVKANDPLRGPELENLVAQLRRCRMPYTCPHGRPTLIEMSFKELEKKFGRIQ